MQQIRYKCNINANIAILQPDTISPNHKKCRDTHFERLFSHPDIEKLHHHTNKPKNDGEKQTITTTHPQIVKFNVIKRALHT